MRHHRPGDGQREEQGARGRPALRTEVTAGERAERDPGEHAEGTVQEARERAAGERKADREDEVLQELHLAPEAPGRRHEPSRGGVEPGVGELVLRLIAAHRRRHHGERFGEQEGAAHGEERPRRPHPRPVDGAERPGQVLAAEDDGRQAHERDRHRAEHVELGEAEPDRRHHAETHRHAGDEPLRLLGGQRREHPQADEPASGGGDQDEREEPEVDHRVLRTPR